MVKTIEWVDNRVRLIDQVKLPLEVEYIDCYDYTVVADAIRELRIRGAPAIGIATAMGVALGAQEIRASGYKEFIQKLEVVFQVFLQTRPTAVNIRWAIERLKRLLDSHRDSTVEELKNLIRKESEIIQREDIEINKAIGRWGAEFIRDGDTIITHCNAGSLATGGYGTATAPIRTAVEQGKKVHVIADETRPVLQGARLTAWELSQDGIPVTLIPDSAAGALMKKGEVNLAIVGTDRTTGNGDVANKIGTYPLSVLCKEHNIPFYVAAPLSSIDFTLSSGDDIEIEERAAEEVTTCGGVRIAPLGIRVRNIAFDVTPAHFVTAIFTEKGAFKPSDISQLSDKNAPVDNLRITLNHLKRQSS
jgi:methylthioribose-1-phosphate isomerase